jgi:hypothetical protein
MFGLWPKLYPTNFLVMAKTFVFVWMITNYLARHCLFGQYRSLCLPVLANSWATKRLANKTFGESAMG